MKLFNHSHLAPLVIYKPTEFGTKKVESLNNIAASIELVVTKLPSILAPRPALPESNPYGSLALVTVPLFKTVQLIMYGDCNGTVTPAGLKAKAYPVSFTE